MDLSGADQFYRAFTLEFIIILTGLSKSFGLELKELANKKIKV